MTFNNSKILAVTVLLWVLILPITVQGDQPHQGLIESSFLKPTLQKSPQNGISAEGEDLSLAYAFPVPFVGGEDVLGITFTGIPYLAEIEIRAVNGDVVRTLNENDTDGKILWNLKNTHGENVMSDVYFYRIRSGLSEKTGKLVVVK